MTKAIKFQEGLSQVREIYTWAELQDVSGLKSFLFNSPQVPLLCVGAGGSLSPMAFAATLYSAHQGMARAINPLAYSSLSDATLRHSRTLLLSKSGRKGFDNDVVMNRALEVNKDAFAVLTHTGDSNDLIKKMEADRCFVYDWKDTDGFIAVSSPFAIFALLYKTYTNDSHFVERLDLSANVADNYTYAFVHPEHAQDEHHQLTEFKQIKHFVVLYSGWAESVAIDFESKMVESGFASVQLCDYRNFTHGRFIFVSNHLKDTAVVLLQTPRDADMIDKLFFNGIFPAHTQVVRISTDYEGPLAALDLLYKTSVFFGQVGESVGYDPNAPKNYGKVDKRKPRSMSFTSFKREKGLPGLRVSQ